MVQHAANGQAGSGQLIEAERIACDARASSKKRALELLSRLLATATPRLSETEVFDSLVARERLGSTGLGHGVAIPHARVSGSERAVGAFVKLAEDVSFDAVDGRNVDLLYGLLVPEHYTDEHLQILAELAQTFGDEAFCQQLRHAESAERLFDLLHQRHADREPA